MITEASTATCNILQPTPHMMLKLNICDTDITFHYDSGCVKSVQMRSYFWSVFSCIRIDYGVDGSTFKFNGIVYLNIEFVKSNSQGTHA